MLLKLWGENLSLWSPRDCVCQLRHSHVLVWENRLERSLGSRSGQSESQPSACTPMMGQSSPTSVRLILKKKGEDVDTY
jgi:hypothetical protein